MTRIKTHLVADRRPLRFLKLADIQTDVDHLALCREVRNLGNWSSGQVLKHVALTMDRSIDGFDYHLPAPVKFALRLFLKRRFLTRPIPAGYQLPRRAAADIGPPATTFHEGLRAMRHALARLRSESKRAIHPAFGPLTAAEWELLHCRHAELHLSFLLPVEGASVSNIRSHSAEKSR